MNDLDSKKYKKLFPDNTLLVSYRGSISHNTYIEPEDPNSSDDVDLLGVHFAPPEIYLGIRYYDEYAYEAFVGKYDVVSYEFKKMIDMLLKGNPNVISILFLNDDHYLHKNFYGRALIDNRDLFISKHVYKALYHYSANQLEEMSKGTFQGYMGSKRKALVEKYGFDIRHASHCIRLMRMAKEFASTGKLEVFRNEDAQDLIDIKTGKWALDEIQAEARSLSYLAEEAYKRCDLPSEPKFAKVYKLVEEIMYDYISSSMEDR